jgi:hypothetical protein
MSHQVKQGVKGVKEVKGKKERQAAIIVVLKP